MSEEAEEVDCNCPPEGLPAWLGTFADLMSLLMCFFVLLLSFAEMDALKYKMVVDSQTPVSHHSPHQRNRLISDANDNVGLEKTGERW